MGLFNRRNAFFGWLVWTIGKRVVKRKAKAAMPSIDTEAKRPSVRLVVLALAGAGAAALLWWRRSSGGGGSFE